MILPCFIKGHFTSYLPSQIAVENLQESANTGLLFNDPITPIVSFTGCSLSGNPNTDIGLYLWNSIDVLSDFTGNFLAELKVTENP